jgi:site-specific DNA recombinase
VFIDAGESAKTTDRPEFRRLLEHCRRGRGRLHAVIVYSLTRFSRNSTDHHAIAGLLRGLGITLRSVTEPIDDSPSGRLMEGILGAMAQFDNDVRSQRVAAGMRATLERGRWPSLAPVGYLNGERRRPQPRVRS